MGEFVMHRLFPIVCNMSLTASVVILAAAAVVMYRMVLGAEKLLQHYWGVKA